MNQDRERMGRMGAHSSAKKANEWGFPQALAAALLRRAQEVASIDRNALSRDRARYLKLEVAVRVIEVEGERTSLRFAVGADRHRFTEVTRCGEVM